MALNFTNEKVSAVYDSLLHLDGPLTSTNKIIYDGIGNGTKMSISTVGVSISGQIRFNNLDFSTFTSATTGILSASNGVASFVPRPIKTDVRFLSTVAILSGAAITYDPDIIPTSPYWGQFSMPRAGDKVIVMQKYMSLVAGGLSTLRDIKLWDYQYNVTIWNKLSSAPI
jgi:hypothetical protein